MYIKSCDLTISWCPGEPNNSGGSATSVTEGCAELSYSYSKYCINDLSCTYWEYFMCEYSTYEFRIYIYSGKNLEVIKSNFY